MKIISTYHVHALTLAAMQVFKWEVVAYMISVRIRPRNDIFIGVL